MKKTTIYLPDETFTWLEQEMKRTELKMAEIIRRAINEYREKRPVVVTAERLKKKDGAK